MVRAASNLRPLVVAFNVAALGTVFVFDALTPADNVSVCFAYTIPIVLSMLEGGRRTLFYTGCAIVLSILGSFIQPPDERITMVFVTNRLIAVVTLLMMALLVRYRLAMEAALQGILDEQREQIDRQRRFIAMLSHEVRTPLTVMDGHAYRLIKRGHAMPADDMVKRAHKIRAAAARVNSIITAVQALVSVGTEEVAPNLQPIDLRALLDGLTQNEMDGGAVILSDLDGLPDGIDADPLLLTQAFENILGNAVKYSPTGSVITVSGACDAGWVELRVGNRGSGIDPADLPKLFSPYFRGANSRGVPGAGIGLHLVERFITAHRGTVSLDSRPGEGTIVTVRLPLRQPGESV